MITPKIKTQNVIQIRAKSKVLKILGIKQKQSDWCWVICATMVLRYYGNSSINKCDFANFLFHQTTCCINRNSSACNKPCKWKDIKKVYSHWSIKSTFKKGSVRFSTIVSEIHAGRPVQIGYEWIGGDGHVALVIGYKILLQSKLKYLHVNDPLYGNGWHLYKDINTAYGIRKWKYTWTSIKKIK